MMDEIPILFECSLVHPKIDLFFGRYGFETYKVSRKNHPSKVPAFLIRIQAFRHGLDITRLQWAVGPFFVAPSTTLHHQGRAAPF